jgi:hypothetical protein
MFTTFKRGHNEWRICLGRRKKLSGRRRAQTWMTRGKQ